MENTMRKNQPLKQRRGFTLVELTIVLTVMAIISSMIVSFSVLISAQVNKNDARADFLEQTATFRTQIQQEFATIDAANTKFEVSVDENSVNFKEVSFEEDTQIESVAVQPNDNLLKIEVSFEQHTQIESVAVEVHPNEPNSNLLKITIISESLKERQSFLLFSHCGATFNEVTQ